MGYFSMPKYFQEMPTVGKELVNVNDENAKEIKAVEADIHESIEKALAAGNISAWKSNPCSSSLYIRDRCGQRFLPVTDRGMIIF